jgi:hypothetical protein
VIWVELYQAHTCKLQALKPVSHRQHFTSASMTSTGRSFGHLQDGPLTENWNKPLSQFCRSSESVLSRWSCSGRRYILAVRVLDGGPRSWSLTLLHGLNGLDRIFLIWNFQISLVHCFGLGYYCQMCVFASVSILEWKHVLKGNSGSIETLEVNESIDYYWHRCQLLKCLKVSNLNLTEVLGCTPAQVGRWADNRT